MSIFKNFDWSAKSMAKVAGMILLGLIALTIATALISMAFRTVFQPRYDDYGREKSFDYAQGEAVFSQSLRAPVGFYPPEPSYSTGEDAEDFEVKNYTATIKTRKLEETCMAISELKAFEYVIFETANQNEDSCTYRFKVKNENAAEILAFIEELDPEDLNESIQTIKGTIEAYDKQLEILEKKLISIEETLENAQEAYDEITVLATRKQDVESLATIIDNKLTLIEKLSNERTQIKGQIDRYNQNKADQLDRLQFSFFNVNIFKDLILDWKDIKDSWKFELKSLVRNINETIQGISVNLVVYIVRLAQAAIYFFVSLFLLKFAWLATKRIWKGRQPKNRR